MERCHYCRRGMGNHEVGCPVEHSDVKAAKALYQTGWRIGCSGSKMDPKLGLNSTYRLGFDNGVIALEEAENGYDPRFA